MRPEIRRAPTRRRRPARALAAALFLLWAPLALPGGDEAPARAIAPPRALAPGLAIALFASEPDIATPIAIDVDGRGRVFAIESNTHFQDPGYARHATDRLLILEDADRDGRAERPAVFADGLEQSMALALRRGAPAGRAAGGEGIGLYLATRRDVLLLEDTDGDERADRRTFLARLETREQYPHNGLTGFAFDAEGRLYFAIGENMGVPYRLEGTDGTVLTGGPDGGSIFRMRADGSGLERWAHGFWNTFHLAFDGGGRLFAVDNDPDSRPPCRLLHIVRGGDYGYRRSLGRKGLHPFTAWDGELPGTLPMVSGTGEAPSGILSYERDALPALRGDLVVTSWGDHRLEAYRLEPRGASFRARPRAVVEGGEDFRPVGIALAPDGSLYVSDWVDKSYHVHGKGRIWRLGPAGGAGGAGGKAAAETAGAAVTAAASARSAAGEHAADAATLLHALDDPSPAVRLEALLALGRGRDPQGASPPDLCARLEELISGEDPFLAFAATEALSRLASATHLARRLEALAEPAGGAGARLRLGLVTASRRAGAPFAPGLLEDPDPEIRRAALQWVGEEGLEEHAAALERAIEVAPLTRSLLDAYLAARGLLAGESPERRDELGRDSFLVELLRDPGRPAALRALALRSVAPAHPGLGRELFARLLAEERDGALRLEAVRSLRESAFPEARALLEGVAADAEAPEALRREAVIGLARFLPESRKTLDEIASGDEPPLATEAERALRLSGLLGEARAAKGASAPAAEARAVLPGAGSRPGDAAAGERLFFHPRGPRCSACHTVAGRGGAAGPDLSRAGRTPPERLLEAIVAPSKEIAPGYTTWVLVTPAGAKHGVLVGEEADGALLLAGPEGRIERLPPGEVAERSPSPTSLMPEDLVGALAEDELRDLLAFLASLK